MSILLLDVDGCLTDGKVYVTHKGERFKAFNARDNRAIAEFIANGWEVHIVTTSEWAGLSGFIDALKVFIHYGVDKTALRIQEITQGRPYVALGDDVFDLEMLRGAEQAFCPKDADTLIRNIDGIHILGAKGGEGVVAELARILL